MTSIAEIEAAAGRLDGIAVETPLGRADTETAIDPVCGMTVTVADASFLTEHLGESYYFCAPGCQHSFESDPARFLPVSS